MTTQESEIQDELFQKDDDFVTEVTEISSSYKSKSKCSMTAVFTIWNVMVGASVLTMPYSFYNSGLIIGIFITFASFIIQMRTCIYCLRVANDNADEDYFDMIKNYWGKKGF